MNLKRLYYYCLRAQSLGFRTALQTIYRRIAQKLFLMRWRQKALHCKTPSCLSHNEFMLCSTTFDQHVTPYLFDVFFTSHLPDCFHDHQTLFAKADTIANGRVELFERDYPMIDWGETQFPTSWKTAFYDDIPIIWSTNEHALVQPDVKLPWEYARFNYVFTLGMAYKAAYAVDNTTRAQSYSTTFVTNITNWLDHNPYMIGITWKCPMDVAIRAINLIYGVCFFYQETRIPDLFWQRLFCSLRNHLHYLEHNLELSDKPNNHLLADLLGALFLTLFFKPLPGFAQRYEQMLEAFVDQINHQVMPDGTAYEGSTAYHRLDTEMVLHALILCKAYGLDKHLLEEKFRAMSNFLNDCTLASGTIVQIGDNDSGKIVAGLITHPQKINLASTYKDFGLSIIRHNDWHITFRHPTYTSAQPTGHFHQDYLSITLALNDIPFIVDPGSYTYTPNGWARNAFRSINKHNTFFVAGQICDNTPLEALDLFQLKRQNTPQTPLLDVASKLITLKDQYDGYAHKNIILERTLSFDVINQSLSINDKAMHEHKGTADKKEMSWALYVAPSIKIEKLSENVWILSDAQTNTCLRLKTSFPWILVRTTISPSYGTLQESYVLQAHCAINDAINTTVVFSRD